MKNYIFVLIYGLRGNNIMCLSRISNIYIWKSNDLKTNFTHDLNCEFVEQNITG